MNGKRSIYVALTSLASPNEELNVLSTAAEQDKKHCNSQRGAKRIYEPMINETRKKAGQLLEAFEVDTGKRPDF